MRHEPVEFGLAGTSARSRSAHRAARSRRLANYSQKVMGGLPAVEVLDEAFAGFAPPSPKPLPQALMADLSAQLAALDRQRHQLSQLLRSIDANSISQ